MRSRLLAAMLRERGTRAGLVAAAAAAGYLARVFEPGRPADTGAYGVAAGLAWSVAGGWGSLSMPLESLVTLIEVTPTASVVGVAALAPVGAALAEALPAGGAAWVRVTAA